MDRFEKKHVAAAKKMLKADNDKAFDISGRRNAELLGVGCGLLCAPAARLIYSVFDKASRIVFKDCAADTAVIELAIVVIAAIYALFFMTKYIRFRSSDEYADFACDDHGFFYMFGDDEDEEDDELPFE